MVSHLFFANDNLIFYRAAASDYHYLKEIFYVYSAAFGQCFNFAKSSMLFSLIVCAAVHREVTKIFGFTLCQLIRNI